MKNLKPIYIAATVILSLCGCTDDISSPSSSSPYPNNQEDLTKFDLGGFFKINIKNSNVGTRSDNDEGTNPNIGNSFNDGLYSEYQLAEGTGHHYAILYNKGDDYANSTPWAVMPLSVEDGTLYTEGHQISGEETSVWDNVTLIARSITVNTAVVSDNNVDVMNLDRVKALLSAADYMVFFLLNFDKEQIYTGNESTVTVPVNASNEKVLLGITRQQYLNDFFFKDYKITLLPNGSNQPVDYFTMTNATYIQGNQMNYGVSMKVTNDDGSLNIFTSEEEAKDINKTAAITAYIERLACKYTVKFDVPVSMSGIQDSEIDATDEFDTEFKIDKAANGLPILNLKVNKYTQWKKTGNSYAILSEPVEATVRIIGYGIGNVEKITRPIKKLSTSKNYFANWNQSSYHRSYWSEDPHYTVSRSQYPHQYRLALDHDSVVSYHSGEFIGNNFTSATVNGIEFYYYSSLGTPVNTFNPDCVLQYKSFNDMKIDGLSDKSKEELNAITFYSLENTYYDTGMDNNGGIWSWPNYTSPEGGYVSGAWYKEPYTTATCLFVLAELDITGYNSSNPDYEGRPVCYRGQNNIFYFNKANLLKSKTEIFSQVMLNGGNAAINILHGEWDRHSRWTEEDENQYKDTHVDQVAYQAKSVLWIAEYDDDGTLIRKWEEDGSHMDLIRAEISGGDGQCLIAPAESVMGKNYRYFLAPPVNIEKDDGSSEITWDTNYLVEISYNHLVALIHKLIGPIDVFTNGYMYYAIPIPHYQSDSSLADFVMKGDNASFLSLGKIGVVRNNWYEITVTNFTNLGTPVHDAAQPIVPVMDIRRSYLKAGSKLLNWHTILQDNVPMM